MSAPTRVAAINLGMQTVTLAVFERAGADGLTLTGYARNGLLADPAATLAAEGAPVPDGLTVKAVENTYQLFHLVIPAKPGDLSDADLDQVSGGTGYGFCSGQNPYFFS